GTTYWWRLRSGGGTQWSATRSFVVDAVPPAFSGPQIATNSATGPWTALPAAVYMSSNVVTLRLNVQDALAGLMASTGVPQGLAGQWHLDESSGAALLDASALRLDGSLFGYPQYAAGRRGSALVLGGAGQYADFGDQSAHNFGAGAFSVSFWLKTTQAGARGILAKDDTLNAGYRVGINAGRIQAYIYDGAASVIVNGTRLVNDNGWHHVAMVRTSAWLQVYIDGVLDKQSASAAVGSTDFATPLQLGVWNSLFFTGTVDELRLFSVARSSVEVLGEYESDQLAAHERGKAYAVAYSTTAGLSWTWVSTTSLSLAGSFNTDKAARVLQASSIHLVCSTGSFAGTNRIAVAVSDYAGNVSTAVYTVYVDTVIPPVSPIVAAVGSSSITVSYGLVGADGYVVEASTRSDFAASSIVSSASLTTLNALAPQDLDPNTTYYLRAGAIWGATTSYAYATPNSTATLARAPSNLQVFAVFVTSMTANWRAMPSAALAGSSSSASGYLLQVSSYSDFSQAVQSSATPNIALSTIPAVGLYGGKTYWFRVAAYNHNGVPNFSGLVSQLLPVVLSIDIPNATVDLGTRLLGDDIVVATRTSVLNDGNVRETYTLRATSVTAGSPWAIAAAAGDDQYVLWSIFDGTVQPLTGAFLAEDRLTHADQVCTGTRFTNGAVSGVGVPYGTLEYLWFRFAMPTGTTTRVQQDFQVTVTAEEAP
ncbi:MAG: LamG domain-containing protein, partial [Elusimicrobiota bacterium]